jgi:hypothetical protein
MSVSPPSKPAGIRRWLPALAGLAAILLPAQRAESAAGSRSPLFTTDVSVQSVTEAHGGRSGLQYDAGLDSYGSFAGADGDVVTFIGQLGVSRAQRHPAPPGFFEDGDDTAVLIKVATLNFHLNPERSLNLKVGHFEIPYGLEANISNAGELRSFTRGANTGLMLDWGATLNGTLPKFQYEVGLGRGSGMTYSDRFDPYSLAARIGTAADYEGYAGVNAAGISVFRGRILNMNRSAAMWRERIAFDAQHYHGPFGLLLEASAGNNGTGPGRTKVAGALVELNVTNPSETLSVYVQATTERQRTGARASRGGNLVAGVRWSPDRHWILSLQRDEAVWRPAGAPAAGFLALQIRHRL